MHSRFLSLDISSFSSSSWDSAPAEMQQGSYGGLAKQVLLQVMLQSILISEDGVRPSVEL